MQVDVTLNSGQINTVKLKAGNKTMTEENRYKGSVADIAVSLSGGGVRAVGYHLGTLSMLDRLDLLKNVEILSSVSRSANRNM